MQTSAQDSSKSTNSSIYGKKLDLWEKKTQWVMAFLALGFLGVYTYQVIYHLQGTQLSHSELALNAIWAAFLLDYLIRLALAQHRWTWVKNNLLDLASVALPVLRPLRLIRLITLLNVLQRTTGESLRDRIIAYAISSTALLVIVSSLAILEAERGNSQANITTFPDALWWSTVTITTVGYGDYTPVTPLGRLITLALMLGGMALIGVITATLASWITERAANDNAQAELVTHEHIKELERSITTLREEIHALHTNQAPPNLD